MGKKQKVAENKRKKDYALSSVHVDDFEPSYVDGGKIVTLFGRIDPMDFEGQPWTGIDQFPVYQVKVRRDDSDFAKGLSAQSMVIAPGWAVKDVAVVHGDQPVTGVFMACKPDGNDKDQSRTVFAHINTRSHVYQDSIDNYIDPTRYDDDPEHPNFGRIDYCRKEGGKLIMNNTLNPALNNKFVAYNSYEHDLFSHTEGGGLNVRFAWHTGTGEYFDANDSPVLYSDLEGKKMKTPTKSMAVAALPNQPIHVMVTLQKLHKDEQQQ